MIAAHEEQDRADGRPWGWATWRTTWLFAVAVLLARIVYLQWLCPYELAGDEAHYWEWSRHLDLSYYSKGPGVAWLIAASVALFGISEWAVRLPAVLAAFFATLALARLATAAARGDERAGFAAAALFTLAPIYVGSAQFMTIDGPYYACWIVAALVTWRICEGDGPLWRFAVLGLVMGVGILFKYTILLLLPASIFLILFRSSPPLTRGRRAAGIGLLLAAMLLAASPVPIWNHRVGWPTLAHLMGHAGLPGGDIAPERTWLYNPLWTLGYLLYPVVVLGPPVTILTIQALQDARRNRTCDPAFWRACVFALVTALPILFFYLLVSFRTDIELNWAAAGYTVLLVPAALLTGHRSLAAPAARSAWRWSVGFGVVCAMVISFGKWPVERLVELKIHGHRIEPPALFRRVSGHAAIARSVEEAARRAERLAGKPAFIVASTYSRASLLAFYLANHPAVYCASPFMGGRESSYDYFKDTSLGDPSLLGAPAVMVGASDWLWDESLYFGRLERTRGEGPLFVGLDYRGPTYEPRRP